MDCKRPALGYHDAFDASEINYKYPETTKPEEIRIPNGSFGLESLPGAFSEQPKVKWNQESSVENLPSDDSSSCPRTGNDSVRGNTNKDVESSQEYLQMRSYSPSPCRQLYSQLSTPKVYFKSEPDYTMPDPLHLNPNPSKTSVSPSSHTNNLSVWSASSTHPPTHGTTTRETIPEGPVISKNISQLQHFGNLSTNQAQISNEQSMETAMPTKESKYNDSLCVTSSSVLKRRIADEMEDNHKRACNLKISNRKSVIKANRKFQCDEPSHSKSSMFNLYVSPNIYNYLLSVFEHFPFISYEKGSLASIFKNFCKMSEGWIDMPVLSQSTSVISTVCLSESNEALTSVHSNLDPMHPNPCSYDQMSMDDLYNGVMTTHRRCIQDEAAFMSDSEIKSAQNTFWDLCQFQEMLHGKLTFIEDDKYYKIWDTTGIDFDKRREYLMTYLCPNEACLLKMIKFINSLPGFDEFTLADKITLTKSCTHDYYFLSRHRGIDTERSFAIDEESKTAYRFDPVMELFPTIAESREIWLDLTTQIKTLSLTTEEIILMKALVATNPDVDEALEQPDIVKECHETYRQCLLNLERKRHGPRGDERFSHIVKVFFDSVLKLRETRKHSFGQMSKKILRLVGQNASPLLREISTWDNKEIDSA